MSFAFDFEDSRPECGSLHVLDFQFAMKRDEEIEEMFRFLAV